MWGWFRNLRRRELPWPPFKPCVIWWPEVGATEMILEDTMIVWHPWGPYQGHAVDLGYSEDGRLVGIKIWDNVATIGCLIRRVGGEDMRKIDDPIEVIARHLAEDDTAYSDMDEARLAAQRILDALLHGGFLVKSFRSEVEGAIDRGIASAQATGG